MNPFVDVGLSAMLHLQKHLFHSCGTHRRGPKNAIIPLFLWS